MVLSGCHSFSDTCSERQLPCPFMLRRLSAICPLPPTPRLCLLAPFPSGTLAGFWFQRALGVFSPDSLEETRRRHILMGTDFDV